MKNIGGNSSSQMPNHPDADVAADVIGRQLGGRMSSIVLERIMSAGDLDMYDYSAQNGILVIRGNSVAALCRGFHDYLRDNGLGMVGWAGPRIRIPDVWPDTPLTRVESPFRLRHCYNVVTAGYTFPYWTWERWEQELDWLALHGYTMILAPVATEAIATRVWKTMGLRQEEIDAFYVGPAHLPWQRMGNIQGVGGTLNDEWHRDQVELQHKILGRCRELGIEPIVQTFAGFVTSAIQRLYPEVKLHETHWNDGFPPHQRPVVLMPDNPLFAEISKAYITQWKEEFGNARYYLLDSFNEMELPETDQPVTDLLATYGRHTYNAITAGDPDGVWVIQGWMFYYQRSIWNHDTVKSLLDAVPDDRMLILDYANDYNNRFDMNQNWVDFDGYFGKPWMMGYVPNMGGKTAYTGNMAFYAEQVEKTLAHPLGKAVTGFTVSGEGLENNEVLYEIMSDTAWSPTAIELDVWIERYCRARYGNAFPEDMKRAWQLYRETCYSSLKAHPRFGWQTMTCGAGTVIRDPGFVDGVRSFLACRHVYADSPSYRDDALEMTALALGLRADDWFAAAKAHYDSGDISGMDSMAERGLAILLDADRLLESHSLNRLERWIAFARQHSEEPVRQDEYEQNARQIVTVWGPPVNDYAARVWSGLIRDFYQPRMRAYFEGLKGNCFDRRLWEDAWVSFRGVSVVEPYAEPVERAAELIGMIYDETIPALPESGDVKYLGDWLPGQVGAEWKTTEWELSPEQVLTLKGVRFKTNEGADILEIQSVALIADGHEVAVKTGGGVAAPDNTTHTYIFDVPKGIRANNGCFVRAVIRSGSGTSTCGKIQLLVDGAVALRS